MTLPVMALVGHPNVGKSTLFNRIAEERLAIVDDMPGVTRDRLYAQADWLSREFNIIDTGGLTLEDEPIEEQIYAQAQIAIDEADVIVFVGDVTTGVTSLDEQIARILFQSKKPIVLAVNKVDSQARKSEIFEFYSLGLGEPLAVSGEHGKGIGDVLDAVVANFPAYEEAADENKISFSLIGRPNVGKSSLVNAVLGEERVIVSNIPGTTRDAIDTDFVDEESGLEYTIIDTAGIRKKGKIYESTEKYSVLRALRAIDRSDVILIVIDAEEGIIEQDKRVAGLAHEAGKGIVFIVNKWDTQTSKDHKARMKFESDVRQNFTFLAYVPILFTSAKTKKGLKDILPMVEYVHDNNRREISSSVLNQVIQEAIVINPPPADKGKKLRINYGTQVSVGPPTFLIFVNDEELVHFSYKRYLVNKFRESFDFTGTSLHLIFRNKNK
ncbi:MAG: ribosome biogenesis GTPase Der [Atopococcus tabaci]|uniref:GTPase Der n=1 Tax=Atopococcus tabaci TaxID=269774 RepID=A0AA43RK09_9LACT|nr:ribosome biogenesis GTPase Der [Atopococcus tabaci]